MSSLESICGTHLTTRRNYQSMLIDLADATSEYVAPCPPFLIFNRERVTANYI